MATLHIPLLLQYIFSPLGVFVGFLLFVLSTLVSWSSRNNVPEGIEWVVPTNRLFYVLRGRWQTLLKGQSMMLDAYDRFSKKDIPYIWVNPSAGPEICQPPSQIPITVAQPDTVLSTALAQARLMQIEYTGLYKQVFATPIHIGTTRQALTSHLSRLNDDIVDELLESLENQWGSDTENYRSIDIMATLQDIVARTSNRIFVGTPLCRNRRYLDACIGFAVSLSFGAVWIGLLPSFTKPVLGRLMAIPCWIYFYIAAWYLKPVIRQRISDCRRASHDPSFKHDRPCDFLQWSIDTALKSGDPSELDPYIIAARVLTMNFAAIHTSLIGATHLLIDILASPPSPQTGLSVLDELRAEGSAAHARESGAWSRKALSHMHKLDSCFRESLRLNGFITRGLARVVVAKEGFRLHNGVVAPQGSLLTFPAFGSNHDPDRWGPEPWRFDGFRFARIIEAGEAEKRRREEEVGGPEGLSEEQREAIQKEWLENTRRQGVVTTGDAFLQFGHGKHACPGRFFAANEIKLLLSFIMQQYDIRPLEKRPENGWMLDLLLAPMGVKIMARRRKDSRVKR